MWARDVDAYLRNDFPQVGGWCLPHLWQAIQPLRDAMEREGPLGPAAEIGVYHGKFFIGLARTIGPRSSGPGSPGAPGRHAAIDVFDLQRFNLDGAGVGDMAAFRANLARCGLSESAVRLERADSMAMSDETISQLRAESGGYSLFSVDGCHLAAHTINDIRIAMALTRPTGVIFVDDYYNPSWPGVQEGVARLYFADAPRWAPLLYACNKLFLAHVSYHAGYLAAARDFIRARFPRTRVEVKPRFGYETLTVVPDHRDPSFLDLAAA